jgi:16S rRNA (guanine527-N7)-methyltransferase
MLRPYRFNDDVIGLMIFVETDALPEMTEQWQETLAWQPTPQQQQQFQQLYQLILQGNRQLNLTRITEPIEFWEKHLWDSLRGVIQKDEGERGKDEGEGMKDEGAFSSLIPPCQAWQSPPSSFIAHPSSLRVIDIGTGAGFPGIPVAIVRPDWQVTLLDSTRKKIEFVRSVLTELGIQNARTVSDRVEQVGHQRLHREKYDLALLRAVAPVTVCAEYALPLLKIGGWAVLYRGQWTEAETAALETALEMLGGTIAKIDAFTTPLSQGVRHCIYVQKVAATPVEFPRAVGVPAQRPL